MSSLLVKTLILDMSEILNNIYIDRFLLVAFVKYHWYAAILGLWKLLFFGEKYI